MTQGRSSTSGLPSRSTVHRRFTDNDEVPRSLRLSCHRARRVDALARLHAVFPSRLLGRQFVRLRADSCTKPFFCGLPQSAAG